MQAVTLFADFQINSGNRQHFHSLIIAQGPPRRTPPPLRPHRPCRPMVPQCARRQPRPQRRRGMPATMRSWQGTTRTTTPPLTSAPSLRVVSLVTNLAMDVSSKAPLYGVMTFFSSEICKHVPINRYRSLRARDCLPHTKPAPAPCGGPPPALAERPPLTTQTGTGSACQPGGGYLHSLTHSRSERNARPAHLAGSGLQRLQPRIALGGAVVQDAW